MAGDEAANKAILNEIAILVSFKIKLVYLKDRNAAECL